MESEKKSYYAVIPADVRYDKKLTANAKLLYGEITALCNEKGFCWASNNYFAKLYNVKPQAISRWIKSLEECKYIEIEYIYKGKEITQRKVSINNDTYQQINKGVSIKSEEGINKNVIGYQQNDKENNTINIKDNNIYISDFDLFWNEYPKKVDKKNCYEKFKKKYKAMPDIQTHIDIIKKWKQTTQWKDGFIPNSTTWLNQERWATPIIESKKLTEAERKQRENEEIIRKVLRGE